MRIILILFFLSICCMHVQAQNQQYINFELTISDTGTVHSGEVDTLSEYVGLNNLKLRGFTLGFQFSIVNYAGSADTIWVFVGTTAAFTPGMCTPVAPGETFNSAYNKIYNDLNVFVKSPTSGGLSEESGYKFWLGGI